MMRFADRRDAGRSLAEALAPSFGNRDDVRVLALPRGGVPVAHEVARRLRAPLDVFIVRKLGVPGHEELAMGAIASGGVRILNEDVVDALHLSGDAIDRIEARELSEITRRETLYRRGRPPLDVKDRTVIVVDDGLATGSTMRAAVEALRRFEPARIVVAVPVAPRDTCSRLEMVADEVVCLRTPHPFAGVGLWYADFEQTTDAEVTEFLKH